MSCVDYNKHGLFVYLDDIFCYINLVIKKSDRYIYVEFMYPKVEINSAIKNAISLKDKDSVLHDTITPIIDKILNTSSLKDKFVYYLLSDELHEKIMCDEDYPVIYVCISNTYYNTFSNNSFVDILKIPYIYIYIYRLKYIY